MLEQIGEAGPRDSITLDKCMPARTEGELAAAAAKRGAEPPFYAYLRATAPRFGLYMYGSISKSMRNNDPNNSLT